MTSTNNLDAYWMPFTANRQFKSAPRMLVSASGMHYRADDGRTILDGTAGMWCVNAGHARPRIVEAIRRQAAELDFAPGFQMGHPKAFELASRLVQYLPRDLDHVFFTNSGSESVDTALKIANAFHKAKGQGSRYRWVGRERAYHGVNYGGMSVGGIGPNRRDFGPLMTGVLHLRHTHNLAANAFTRGLPQHGAELADELERLVALNDASTISAVIVEPIAGSTGVLLPPKGYLKKLREICTRHGILLILDEVITGFGRIGSPFAVEEFDVIPDMVTCAKGITNGTVPMGAVFVKKGIHDAFMTGPEHVPEFAHGYTYSGHPVPTAAALATLDIYDDENLLTRAAELEKDWEDALHGLRDLPHVVDIRNFGLVGAIELAPRAGEPGKRAFEAFLAAYQRGLLIRVTGEIIALSPPLIIEKNQIGEIADHLRTVISALQ